MINRRLRPVHATVAALAVAVVLAGCASSSPAAEPTPDASTPAASPTPTPEEQALLVISGTVADQDGNSLAVTLTTTDVREPTDADRADYAADRCFDPGFDLLANPDARIVTLAVASVASAGFTGWTDSRGVRVAGSLFAGDIWVSEQHTPASTCFHDSVIARPGSGEVRFVTSSDGWNLTNPVTGDGAATLVMYGFEAVRVDALGQPTGLDAVADCVTTASPALDALALDLWEGRWGRSQNLPEYCFYGRSAGD